MWWRSSRTSNNATTRLDSKPSSTRTLSLICWVRTTPTLVILNSASTFTTAYFISILHFNVLLPPATKLGQGYIFTGVCDSVNRGGGASSWGCLLQVGLLPAGCFLWGVPPRRGAWWRHPPETATAAGGMHPTGMHPCFILCLPPANEVVGR